MLTVRSTAWLVWLPLLSCASADRPAETPPPAGLNETVIPQDIEPVSTPTPMASEPVEQPMSLPQTCADQSAEMCVPPPDFIGRLCATRHPNVALAMFKKDTPWTRAYVRVREMEAWYVPAGRSRPLTLKFAEEVLIIADRSARPEGMKVSGSGSYDVYRWDGSCVSVMSDEVSLRPPGTPDVAIITWRHLDDGIRDALMEHRKIQFRNDLRLKSCKENTAAKQCQRALRGLSRMVADFVRRGTGELPLPDTLP
ncbi:MAG: hypothetical protein DRI90_22705 [Deltaproteobacteria bacterium]|nr:MAG: hypothetical protein DRI90_22705 [Deltaproteobacteria bacterium]